MTPIRLTALDQKLLNVIAAGVFCHLDGPEIRKRMVVDHGLFLNRAGENFLPLDQADHGYIEGRWVWNLSHRGWMDVDGKKIDVTGKTLTMDQEGTIILRTL